MKRMMVLFVSLMLVGSSFSFAGHGHKTKDHDPEKYVQKKMEKMTKAYHLTEAQQTQVEAILRTKIDKKHAAKKRMKNEMKSIHEEFKSKMNGVLDSDQKEKFSKKVAKWEKKKHKKKKKFLLF